MDAVRKIKVFKSYYKEFYIAQTEAVRKKIDYVIELVKCLEVIPTEYFRKISDVPGLYEIRVSHKGNIFRSEIRKAVQIMKEYYNSTR